MAFNMMISRQKNKKQLSFTTIFITLRILASPGAMASWILAISLCCRPTKKMLVKKISMSKDTRLKMAIDNSRMMCGRLRNGTYTIRSILSEYPKFIEKKTRGRCQSGTSWLYRKRKNNKRF